MESRLSHRPPCRFRGRISRYASMGRIEKRQETIVVPTQTGKETRRPFSDKCRLEDSRRASMESSISSAKKYMPMKGSSRRTR